jgi:LmbE family N-acetylglucosaminyl deacetylase
MPFRLQVVAAHPDDESLGFGGTLAAYAAQGVETSLVMATRGEAGRCGTHRRGSPEHPRPDVLGRIREAELRAAADVLGVGDLAFLGYRDQALEAVLPGLAGVDLGGVPGRAEAARHRGRRRRAPGRAGRRTCSRGCADAPQRPADGGSAMSHCT